MMADLQNGFRLQPGMSVNARGHLCLAGHDLVELAALHGTPLYVLNEDTIRHNCRRYLRALSSYPDARAAYASKAFLCRAMCRLLEEEGMWLDVVSGGELYTAKAAGFPAGRIIFHGINRSLAELTEALEYGVGRIVVDNQAELKRLVEAAKLTGKVAAVQLRVASGVEAHTHEYVQTSLLDSKFGFQLTDLPAVLDDVRRLPLIDLRGLHCHIGSQILATEPFIENLRILLQTVAGLDADRQISELNLGGGLGTYYTADDQPLEVEQLLPELLETARDLCRQLNLPLPSLTLEPGRSIINEAGLTLYRIGGSKLIPGVRHYLFVDGSMADNIRPALYGSKYEAVLANRMQELGSERYSIAGRCCESGDMLAWDQLLPKHQVGDILAIARTGAYNYSMASNYNRLPRPAVLLVSAAGADLIVERECYADLVKLDRIPERMRAQSLS